MKSQTANTLKKCLFLAFLIIAITIVISVVIKYNVEGETSLPYYIEKIRIVSKVNAQDNEDSQNIWNISLEEQNNIFIDIAKNENSSNEIIKEITLNNFNISKSPNIGKISFYQPTGDLNNLYQYKSAFTDSLTYKGARADTLNALEIRNEGGMMAFRISLEDLGNYISNNYDETIVHDGSLLEKANIKEDDITFSVSFDITITLNNNVSFKGTGITIDLPCGNISEESEPYIELTDFSNIVFKRI